MKIHKISLLLILLTFLVINCFGAAETGVSIEKPRIVLANVPFSIDISVSESLLGSYLSIRGVAGEIEDFRINEKNFKISELIISDSGSRSITVTIADYTEQLDLRVIPGWLSLLPPILAIVLALTLREVILALFSGIWLGAIFLNNFNPFVGFMRALDTYLISSLNDSSHVAIVMFSLTLGGMVGVISRSGGTQGIVAKLSKWAKNSRGGQIATWAMGVFIFFDDYANTLIVGNTMRPITDKLRISREKLSYIVDSTAAPVASIAIISSWVGFQIGLISQAFKNIGVSKDAYITFLMSIPYASYSVLAIIFVFLIGLTLRDFATMYRSEQRAFSTGKVLSDDARPLADDKALDLQAEKGSPLRWYNAAIPILVVIFITMFGLYFSGKASLGQGASGVNLGEIIGAADSFDVLMWAAFLGAATAIILAVAQRILTLRKALDAWLSGVKAMIIAMIILILAWAIGNVCGDLNTADFVIAVTRSILSPHLLPLLTFVVAAFIGFATGTSWATMAILVPIVIPMSFELTSSAAISVPVGHTILLGTIGAVLSGSVFGDHCSPISDTTIMSSMTSAADHIDHVRTQLPYAITVAAVASLVGYLPAGFGFPVWMSVILGSGILLVILFIAGRRINSRGVNPEC